MEEKKNGSEGKDEFGVKFMDPERITDELGLAAGMNVAEFGCGTGFFVFPAARRVGQSGKVYALDILKDKLETVESQARIDGLSNIVTKRANLELVGGSKLPDESVDWVMLVNMLFQNKQKGIILEEAKRVLAPKGKMLVIDWERNDSSFGPARDLKVSKDELRELAGQRGLALIRELAVSDFHFGLIFAK